MSDAPGVKLSPSPHTFFEGAMLRGSEACIHRYRWRAEQLERVVGTLLCSPKPLLHHGHSGTQKVDDDKDDSSHLRQDNAKRALARLGPREWAIAVAHLLLEREHGHGVGDVLA